MEDGETTLAMVRTRDYKGILLFVFENGRVSKVDLSAYYTKTNRKKLIGAFCDKFTLHSIVPLREDGEVLISSSNGRMLLLHSGALTTKTTRNNNGVAVMTQKKGQRVFSVEVYTEGRLNKPHRYRTKTLPAAGSLPTGEEQAEQISLI
jgi:DNA gyrase subunit A